MRYWIGRFPSAERCAQRRPDVRRKQPPRRTSAAGRVVLSSLALVAVAGTLSGCLLAVPFIDAFKESGLTPSDRRRLLAKRMKEFHEALMWGDANRAMTFVKTDAQEEVRATLLKMRKQKVVDARTDEVNFNDDATTATVRIVVRFYDEAMPVVRNREESEEWYFNTGIGWELTARQMGAITDS